MALHMVKKHLYRSHTFYDLNTGGICYACNKCFHTPLRLQDHLGKGVGRANACMWQLVLGGVVPNNELEAQSVSERIRQVNRECKALGRQGTFARSPPVVLQGPLLDIYSGPIDNRGWAWDVCIGAYVRINLG